MNELLYLDVERHSGIQNTRGRREGLPTSPLASSSSSVSGLKGLARAVESTKETYKHW